MRKCYENACSIDCFHCEYADCKMPAATFVTPFEREQLQIKMDKTRRRKEAEKRRAAVDKAFAQWLKRNKIKR